MLRTADRRRQDLCIVVLDIIDRADLADQIHAIDPDIIKPPNERRDISRASFRGQPCLGCGEAERDIGIDTIVSQRTADLKPIPGEG